MGMGGSRRLAAEEVVLPQPLKNALARFAELKTFSVAWTQQMQLGASGHAKLGSRKVEAPSPKVYYLVWQGGKMYERRIIGGREWKDAPNVQRDEFFFDGRILGGGCPEQFAYGKPKNPAMRIDLAEDQDANAHYFAVYDFQHMGLHLPEGAGQLLRLKHLESQVLFQLEHGGQLQTVGPAQIEGRPLTRIALLQDNPQWHLAQKSDLAKLEETLRGSTYTKEQIQTKLAIARRAKETTPRKLQQVWYLDPELGYAVRRWQQLSEAGQLRIQSDCTEHKKLPGHEIWLPAKCRTDFYIAGDYPGESFNTPFWIDVMEVSEFGTKPVPDEQFTLKYTIPGSEITDNTLPEAKLGEGPVSYTVPALPQDLDRVIEEARTLNREKAGSAKRRNTFKTVLIVGNTVALAGLLVYLVVRYRRKAARS